MKLLLFGANGQVGSEIATQARSKGIELTACTRAQVDIAQQESIADIISASKPSIVINAAAYTAVDKAETEQEQDDAINAQAPGYIATICASAGIPLLHISTDYVFDGSQDHAYKENDPPQPINHYGKSKLQGEQAIRKVHTQHIILRTSWVFGATGNNFVKTIIRLAQEREQLKIVDDQWGCPTSASSIAKALIDISSAIDAGSDRWGTYHFCGAPPTTWYKFTQKIVSIAQDFMTLKLQELLPIKTEEYPTPAKRPKYTVMQCDKIAQDFGIQSPDWEQNLIELFEREAFKI